MGCFAGIVNPICATPKWKWATKSPWKLLSLRRFDKVFNNDVWAIQKLRETIPQDPFEVWVKG
jgi:hypothetical protein